MSRACVSPVIEPSEIERFLDDGYTLVKDAFDPDAAAAIRAMVYKRLGMDPSDQPSEGFKHIAETFRGEEVERVYSPRVVAAFDELAGAGRWQHPHGLGWWPVLFPGFTPGPWAPPTRGWHVDGSFFHHHLNSREQGLLAIFLFTDTGPDDGGTVFDIGSHKIAAHVLAAEPEGLSPGGLCKRVNDYGQRNVSRVVGKAGDIVVLHPFMNHTTGVNIGSHTRIMCNVCVSLNEPMNFNRADGDYSPVELAIKRALAEPPPAMRG